MNKKDTIPKIKFLGLEISKLILGSNPFSGFSHTSKEMDEEMMDFYTSEEIKKAFDTAKDNGINALCARGDRHILRLIREYYNEGKMENFYGLHRQHLNF